MKQSLYNIAFLIGSIFRRIWNIGKGAVLYILNLADITAKERELDRKLFFRQESKKQMSRWVTEERKFVNLQRKKSWVPSKLKKNDAFFNYVFSVVMNVSPHNTPEEIVHMFYDNVHPYFIQYYHISMEFKKLLKTDQPSATLNGKLPHYKAMMDGLPDIMARSERLAETKKQIARKVKQLETNMKKAEDLKNKQIDGEMLKKNIDLLQSSIDAKNEQLKAFNQALEKESAENGNDRPHQKARK